MTVAELIAKLQKAPQDLVVYCRSDKYHDTSPVTEANTGVYHLDPTLNPQQVPQQPTADQPANAYILSWQAVEPTEA